MEMSSDRALPQVVKTSVKAFNRDPMKLHYVGLLSLLLLASMSAQDKPAESVRPQPRVRLDPSRLKAVERPEAETKKASNVPVMLERLVVKEAAPLPMRRPAVEDPQGEFSPAGGGRLLQRDLGGLKLEAGIWPHMELFEDEARFKGMKVPVEFDFVRLKF
jgi:hypothetical protein